MAEKKKEKLPPNKVFPSGYIRVTVVGKKPEAVAKAAEKAALKLVDPAAKAAADEKAKKQREKRGGGKKKNPIVLTFGPPTKAAISGKKTEGTQTKDAAKQQRGAALSLMNNILKGWWEQASGVAVPKSKEPRYAEWKLFEETNRQSAMTEARASLGMGPTKKSQKAAAAGAGSASVGTQTAPIVLPKLKLA